MDNELIARAEAILAQVTPGEWHIDGREPSRCSIIGSSHIVCWVPRWDLSGFSDDPGPNARFIAAAPAMIADLVAALRAAGVRH